MRYIEILNKGKELLDRDIEKFKDYYLENQSHLNSSNDLDSSIEFELQYLKYLMNVEDNYREAINQANKLKALPNITVYSLSKVNRTLGVAYYHLGEFTSSMESYIESVKLLDKISEKNHEQYYELALTYFNISLLYKNEQIADESNKRLEYIRLAEKIFIEIKSHKGLGLIYSGLSNYYSNTVNYPMALKYQLKSIELKKHNNDEVGLGVNYGNLANIYIKYNKLDKAEYYLLKSKEIKLKESNNYSKCLLFLQLGNLYRAKGDFVNSIEYYIEGLNISIKHELKYEVSLLLTELATTYEKNNNYELAYKTIQRKLVLQESLIDINKSKALLELKYKFEIDKQKDEAKILQQKNAEIQEYITKLKNTNFELRQFAQIASHDLKEPARLIKMHITKLEKSLEHIDESQDYLINFIKKTSDNLYHLVNELQNYTNIDQQLKVKENIQIADELKDIVKHVQRTLRASDLVINISNIPSTIVGNRSQFNQLFFQLIENAFLFNDKTYKQVEITYNQNETHHIFSVIDNGIGIDKAFFSKIFEIFERLHDNSKYQGTGIGLAIAKKIITEMNGFIEIESKLGVGTTFKIYILK